MRPVSRVPTLGVPSVAVVARQGRVGSRAVTTTVSWLGGDWTRIRWLQTAGRAHKKWTYF